MTTRTRNRRNPVHHLRFGSMRAHILPGKLRGAITSLPTGSAAIIDLTSVAALDPDAIRALRQAFDETSQRGITTVIAATDVNVRLPLVAGGLHRVTQIRHDMRSAVAALTRAAADPGYGRVSLRNPSALRTPA